MLRVGSSKKLDTSRNTSPKILLHKVIKILLKLYFDGLLRLKSWDFASMLRLVDMNGTGTWDPISTGLWFRRFLIRFHNEIHLRFTYPKFIRDRFWPCPLRNMTSTKYKTLMSWTYYTCVCNHLPWPGICGTQVKSSVRMKKNT